MNNEKAKFFSARNVALLGILVALVVVLQLFASAVPMLGVTINFSLIPIVLAAILLGWKGGTITGFASGLVIFITAALMQREPSTAYFFQTNPFILTVMCIGKTTIAGAVAGLVFKPIAKKNGFVAVCVCALLIAIINTGIYMLGIVLMKGDAADFLGLTSSTANTVFVFVFSLIWLNFVLEMVVNIIFTPVVYRVIKVIDKKLVIKNKQSQEEDGDIITTNEKEQ